MKITILTILILFFPAFAKTIFVNPGDDLSDSLMTLSQGDTLFIMPGTYTNSNNQPLITAGPSQSGVTITSQADNRAVLSGENMERSIVQLVGPHDQNVFLENLVITGGNATGTTAFNGGGISASESRLIVNNCLITENSALIGGGIGAEGGILQVQYSTISNNEALVTGGGIDLYASVFSGFMVKFISNTSSDDGGGLNAYQSDLTLDNSLFTGNYSGDDGGAITVLQGISTFSFLTIDSNEAFDDGGAFRLHTIDSVSIMSSVITSNLGKAGINVISNNNPYIANVCCWNNGFSNYYGMNDPTGTNGNISEDPLYADTYFNISQIDAGQSINSPALNAGHADADDTVIDQLSTRTDSLADLGVADMGFHHLNASQTGVSPTLSTNFPILTFSPSPATNHLTVTISPGISYPVTLQIFDISGRLVHSFQPTDVTQGGNWSLNIDNSFKEGLMLVRAIWHQAEITGKIMVIN